MAKRKIIAELQALTGPEKVDLAYTLEGTEFQVIRPTGIKIYRHLNKLADGEVGEFMHVLKAVTDPEQHSLFDRIHDTKDFNAESYGELVNDVLSKLFETEAAEGRPTKSPGSRSTGSANRKTSTSSTDS